LTARLVAGAMLLSVCGTPPAPPIIATRIAATLVGGSLVLDGARFGERDPSSRLVYAGGTTPSTDPAVTAWADTSITVVLPATARSGPLAVQTADGTSSPVELEVYAYDFFAVPPTPSTNASPLAVAVDAAHRVWLTSEFQRGELHVLDPTAGSPQVSAFPVALPPPPGPFATRIFGDQRTEISEIAESIIVDDHGRVWASQGGGLLYDAGHGMFANHSRIVMRDPATATTAIWNLPGDHNEVTGLAWDAAAQRLWFAQSGFDAGAAIGSFDPALVAPDPCSPACFDFATPVPPTGFTFHALPETQAYPTKLLLDHDGPGGSIGHIWYSAYLANHLGRLDVATGAVDEVPLPPSIGPQGAFWRSSGPWDLVAAAGGGILFNEQFDSRIGRLDAARVRRGDPACTTPGGDSNPCVSLVRVPDADLATELAHSIALDGSGRLWYSVHGPNTAAGKASLGIALPDLSAIVRLPPLPGAPTDRLANDGIAIDPTTGDIWIAEYFRHRLGRLRRI
jgi:streptogramin lyase